MNDDFLDLTSRKPFAFQLNPEITKAKKSPPPTKTPKLLLGSSSKLEDIQLTQESDVGKSELDLKGIIEAAQKHIRSRLSQVV